MQEYTVKVFKNRTEWFNLQGQLQRVEYIDGSKYWYENGKRHRLGGPAIEHADGRKEWWIDGEDYTEEEFLAKTQTKELTVAEIEKLLGYSVKIVKGE
jgi:hypothetical protein